MPLIDFDAFQRERKAADGQTPEPILFKIGGKEYPLPSEVPAVVVLDVVRLRKQDGLSSETKVEQLLAIGDALFGADVFREICTTNRLSSSEMGQVVLTALGATSTNAEDARPNRKTRRARKASIS